MFTREVFRADGEAGPIRGTRWGAGLRFKVSINAAEIEGNLTAGGVAAVVEVTRASASYELEVFGVASRELVAKLPVIGRFDEEAYAKLVEAEAEVRSFLQDNMATLEPQPVSILLNEPILPAAPKGTRAGVFALGELADRRPLWRALRRARGRGLNQRLVTSVYGDFSKALVESSMKPPDEEVAADALDLLVSAGLRASADA